MAIPATSGAVQYSGTFVPEVWSGKINYKFYDASTVQAITNSNWEGEVKNVGDKVIIRQKPDIVITDYEKYGVLPTQHPDAPTLELLVDRAKAFSAQVDDIDAHQSDVNLMNMFSEDASEQMKIVIDTEVLGEIYADASAENVGTTAGRKSGNINLGTTGSPVALTKVNVIDYIVDLGQVLDEQNVPETGRWMVIPAWFRSLIMKSDLKDASLTGDGKSILRNGRIGMIDRFELYSSNLLPTYAADSATYIMAGQKSSTTFAAQLAKVRYKEPSQTFGQLIQGLNVYGFKVNKPEALAVLYATKG
ncbi:hypothetical protein [Desulfovibrio inopinatus]|uniref:phage major capsid protein n=1 Tax=Desulfovibrio inopinatus TaxID=102109 RepID=UPI000409BD1F|nr:hypothetical protein [Desulfovibrio inopinatus]